MNKLYIKGDGPNLLRNAIKLANSLNSYNSFTHVGIRGNELVVFWLEPKDLINKSDLTKLPFEMDINAVTELIINWLNTVSYERSPDTDGTAVRGWEVFRDNWGYCWESGYSAFGIRAVWNVYGK